MFPSFEYSSSVYAQQAKVDEPTLTPSGQIMQLIENGSEFIDIVKEQALKHQTHFASVDKNIEFHQQLVELATESLQQQSEMEDQDVVSFDEYLEQYNNS